jgi:hypothetical protein
MEPRPSPARRVLFWVSVVVLFAAALELARFDQGFHDPFFWGAFVAAPVIVIFGASAAGARRWYGWPDLGPGPGLAAGLATAVVAGALVGQRVHVADVEASMAVGARLAREVREWRDAHGGAWPPRLEDATSPVPRTRLGLVRPPEYRYDPAARTLGFPIGSGAELVLDVERAEATWRRR